MHFGENQLSRSLIGLSPLPTAHPLSFQPKWVRSSTRSYPRFNLAMGRSLRFGSRPSDSNALFGRKLCFFSSGLTCCLYRVSPLFVGGRWRVRVVGFRPYVENYTVDASIFVSQVFKGARWMPWYQEPKKDVGICDKPRGVDNQTVIRGFPNGETRQGISLP